MGWNEISADPSFLEQPEETRLRVAQNYFSKNIDSSPSFRAAVEKDPSLRDKVWGNFVAKAIPKKMSKGLSIPFSGFEGVEGSQETVGESKPSPTKKESTVDAVEAPTSFDSDRTIGTRKQVMGIAPPARPPGIYAVHPETDPITTSDISKGIRQTAVGVAAFPITVAQHLAEFALTHPFFSAYADSDPEAAKALKEKVEGTISSATERFTQGTTSGSERVTQAIGLPFEAVGLPAKGVRKLSEMVGADETTGQVIEDAALLATFAGIGVSSKTAKAVKDSNWYRKATIKERGLVVQTVEDLRRAGASEAELARKSPEYWKEAFKKRGGHVEGETAPAPEPAKSSPTPIPESPKVASSEAKQGTVEALDANKISVSTPPTPPGSTISPEPTPTPVPPVEVAPEVPSIAQGTPEFYKAEASNLGPNVVFNGVQDSPLGPVPMFNENPGVGSFVIDPRKGEKTAAEAYARKVAETKKAEHPVSTPSKSSPAPVPPVKVSAEGAATTVRTERGTEVGVRYAIVEASQLIASHDTILRVNKGYPAELQPRDRTRAASEVQIDNIARNLVPEFLGESPKASDGAPIIGPDGAVESGNARVIALQRVYENNTDASKTYRGWLQDNPEKFGLRREQITAVRQPVLVRIRTQDIDRVKFAQEANEASVAAMSPTERAMTDAKNIPVDVLSSLAVGETGEIVGASKILSSMLNPQEMAAYMLPGGGLNQDGIRRVRNAVFAKAYTHPMALEKIAESTDSQVKNIGAALLTSAPKIAAMREAIARGELHSLDIGPDLGSAMAKLAWLREQTSITVDMYLAQLTPDGGNLFGQRELSSVGMDILKTFDVHKRSSKIMVGIMDRYLDYVIAAGHPKQVALFGPTSPPTVLELWQKAKIATEAEAGLSKSTPLFAEKKGPRMPRMADRMPDDPAGGTTRPTPGEEKLATDEQRPRMGYHLGFMDEIPATFLEMPELIEFINQIASGKLPKVAAKLQKGLLGYYSPKSRKITINALLFQDDPVTGMTGEERARKTIAHEIGHFTDDMPDWGIGHRGNILGRIISSLNTFRSDMIDAAPTDVSQVITKPERDAARKRAVKEAKAATEDKEERKKIAKEHYSAWFADELSKRKVLTRKDAMDELKRLTMAWKPFDENTSPAFTKYRYSAPELYADAKSVLINYPELFVRLAPKTWESMLAYMEEKPEFKAAWDEWQQKIIEGRVPQERQGKLTEMLDDENRIFGEKAVRRKLTANEFLDGILRGLVDKYYHVTSGVKKVIKRGVKVDSEKNPAYLFEEFVYRASEKRGYARGIQGLARDLSDSGISLTQINEYLFHRRIVLEGRSAQMSYQATLNELREAIGQDKYDAMVLAVERYRRLPKRKQDLQDLFQQTGALDIQAAAVEEYIRLTHGVGRGRSQMANPKGYTPRTSQEALEDLRKRMGAEKFDRLQNGMGVYQTSVRRYITDRLREAEMLDPVMQDWVEQNLDSYVAFAVSSHIEAGFGPGIYAKIFRQSGTLQNIISPLTATIMKDLAILDGINRKMAVRSLHVFWGEHFGNEIIPADKKEYLKWNGRRLVPKEPSEAGLDPKEWALMVYPHLGKIVGFYINPKIASAFEHNPMESNIVISSMRWANEAIWKAIFVNYRPGFLFIFNPLRDYQRLGFNMPKATPLGIPGNVIAGTAIGGAIGGPVGAAIGGGLGLTTALIERKAGLGPIFPYWWRGLKKSFRNEFGLTDETVVQMELGKMMATVEDWSSLDSQDKQNERIYKRLQLIPMAMEKGVWNKVRYMFEQVRLAGMAVERAPKVAGVLYLMDQLDSQGNPLYTNKEIAHKVRGQAGTPDVLRKGEWSPIYNNLYLFSNIAKESYRSDFEVAKESPGEFFFKRAKYVILPKLIMYSFIIGWAGKKMKDLYDNISAYDLTNYLCVAIGEDANGKTVYVKIPLDESSRFTGGLVWKALMGRKASDMLSLADYTAGQAPNLTPTIGIMADVIDYYRGRNPYDSFRNKFAVSDPAWRASKDSSIMSMSSGDRWAAWQSHKQFSAYLAKKAGADVIYRFNTGNPKKITTTLEKVLRIPVIGTDMLGRFIKISDQGTREHLKEVTGDIDVRNWKRSLYVERLIQNKIDSIDNPTPVDSKKAYVELMMDKTYQKMLESGQNGADGKPIYNAPVEQKDFDDLYWKWSYRAYGTPYLEALTHAQSKEKKTAIVNEFLKRMKKE